MFTLIGWCAAIAQDDDKKESSEATPVEITGFVDSYYSFNVSRPESRINQLRNFDIDENQLNVSLVKISVQKQSKPIGFHFDFFYGSTADIVNSLDSKGTFRFVEQAYGTVIIPVGKGLTVDVGKFVTHLGSEVIEAKANWNYSRSLLFSWAIPYFHTGVRMTYPVNSQFSVMGMIASGWNNVTETNKAKTYGGQIIWSPIKNLSLIQNWIGGAELSNNNNDWRTVWDGVIQWQVMDALTLNGNYDYGTENVAGQTVHWSGVAGMARYAMNEKTAATIRAEWFNDSDGNQTLTVQKVKEITLTGEWRPYQGIVLRGEFRRDWSNKPVFDGKTSQSQKNQNTFLVGTIFEF